MAVLVERDSHRSQTGHLREDRVTIESGLAQHNQLTGPSYPMKNLHRHTRRPRSEYDLFLTNSDSVRDQPPQLPGQKLRIAVGRIDRGHQRRADGRQRRKGALVERQREWINSLRQGSEDLGGHRASVRQLGHQSRPPQRIAAAPAKSPACANAGIMTTSPAASSPSALA